MVLYLIVKLIFIKLLEKSCKRVIEAKQIIMKGIQRDAQPSAQLIKALKSMRYARYNAIK